MAYRTPTVVALSTALATAAVVAAGPAAADPNRDFLNLLTSAGIAYGNAGDTTDLGRQVCNMLVQPGKDFASTVAEVQNRGVNPDMASFFAGIAIQAYCPQFLASVADGSVLNQLNGLDQLPGFNGLVGSSLLAGLGAF